MTRVLYHSAAPWVASGYGRCTSEIAGRLHNGDHDVAIKTLSSLTEGSVRYHGEHLPYKLEDSMKVYSSKGDFGMNSVKDNFEDFDADIYFTHFDSWMDPMRKAIPDMEIPYASYVIVDHYPAPNAVTSQVRNAQGVIAMSKYGEEVLSQKGVRPFYIPHGVNTDEYFPYDTEHLDIETRNEKGEMRTIDTDEVFVIGMVAANFGNRKRIAEHMEAFKMFLNEVDENAILYLHTDMNPQNGFNLHEIKNELNIPERNIVWARAEDYMDVGDEYLNAWYNAMDVMMNCSMGESWGLTITEAQSAGTPCIVNEFSSMPEQIGGKGIDGLPTEGDSVSFREYPHGLAVVPDVGVWKQKVSAKQYICSPGDICKALQQYYENPDMVEEHGEKAAEYVRENYDWEESVIPEWQEFFNMVE